MQTGPARRALVLAAVSAAAIPLSGCHYLLQQTFSDSPRDPPVHAAPGMAGPAEGGTPFRGRAEGELASRMTIKHGSVKTRSNWARFAGTYSSNLGSHGALGPVANAQWHGRFRVVRNRRTGSFTIRGLVLATFDDADEGRACVRLGVRGKRRQNRKLTRPGRSTLAVLGGEGGASTLRGRGVVRVRLAKDDSIRLRGRVKSKRGGPRGLTPACARLERQFGLSPVT